MQNDNSASTPDLANSQSSAFDYDSLDLENSIVIKFHTEAIKERIQRSNRDIIEIGERLMDVKERLPHGQFGLWLQVEFNWDTRTAQRFMSVAAMFKSDTVSFLATETDTVSVSDCVEAGTLNIATGALYILAAKSTPEEIRREVLERAYHGEQFTQAKVKQIVAKQKKQKTNTKSNPDSDDTQTSPQHRLVPVRERSTQSEFYKVGDLAVVACGAGVPLEWRRWNGYWGVVRSIGHCAGSVEVIVRGFPVRYMPSDLEPIDNPDGDFKVVTDKVNRLLQRDDLDEFERSLLEMYCKRFSFSDRQLQLLDSLVAHYEEAD